MQVAARAVDDLECHKPIGEGGNLDNHDLSGGKKVDIQKGTESPPVASSEPALLNMLHLLTHKTRGCYGCS